MKRFVVIGLMMLAGLAQAQSYPKVINGVTIHMKDSEFYSEKNYGGYTFKGCNIVYMDSETNKKVIFSLDGVSHYTLENNGVKIHALQTYRFFKPNNHNEFVDALMSYRYYCLNNYLLTPR